MDKIPKLLFWIANWFGDEDKPEKNSVNETIHAQTIFFKRGIRFNNGV